MLTTDIASFEESVFNYDIIVKKNVINKVARSFMAYGVRTHNIGAITISKPVSSKSSPYFSNYRGHKNIWIVKNEIKNLPVLAIQASSIENSKITQNVIKNTNQVPFRVSTTGTRHSYPAKGTIMLFKYKKVRLSDNGTAKVVKLK